MKNTTVVFQIHWSGPPCLLAPFGSALDHGFVALKVIHGTRSIPSHGALAQSLLIWTLRGISTWIADKIEDELHNKKYQLLFFEYDVCKQQFYLQSFCESDKNNQNNLISKGNWCTYAPYVTAYRNTHLPFLVCWMVQDASMACVLPKVGWGECHSCSPQGKIHPQSFSVLFCRMLFKNKSKNQASLWWETNAHFASEEEAFSGSADIWLACGVNQRISQALPQDTTPVVHSAEGLSAIALWISPPDTFSPSLILFSPALH